MTKNKEIRSFSFEIRADKDPDTRKMVGHAAVFGEPTEIGGWFREQIEPGAFKTSIKKDDIRALFNHNPDFVLGRNTAKTLTLKEDKTGLKVEIDPPDTQLARDLAVSIDRGDISQMSFAFRVTRQEWVAGETEKDMDTRIIKEAQLFDVSPVTFPAYEGTDIAMRARDEWRKEKRGEDTESDPPAIERNDVHLKRMELLRRY